MSDIALLASALNHDLNDQTLAICYFDKISKKLIIAVCENASSHFSSSSASSSSSPAKDLSLLLSNTKDSRIVFEKQIASSKSSTAVPDLKWLGKSYLLCAINSNDDGSSSSGTVTAIDTQTGKFKSVSLSDNAKSQQISSSAPCFIVTSPPSLNPVSSSSLQSRLFGVGLGEHFALFDIFQVFFGGASSSSSSPATASLLESRTKASRLTCGSFLPFLSSTSRTNSSSSESFNNNETISVVFGTTLGMEITLLEAKIVTTQPSSSSASQHTLSCRGGGFVNSEREEFSQYLSKSGVFQSSPFFQQSSSNHHCGSATLMAVHPIDISLGSNCSTSCLIALAHENSSAIGVFDIANYSTSRPLVVVRANGDCCATSKLGSRILSLSWSHSPADLLTVITLDSIEILRPFSSSCRWTSSVSGISSTSSNSSSSIGKISSATIASSNQELGDNQSGGRAIFTCASSLWWSASPSILCFGICSSSATKFNFIQTPDHILDQFAPTKMLSLHPFIPPTASSTDDTINQNADLFLMNSNLDFMQENGDGENGSDDDGNGEAALHSSPFAFTLQQSSTDDRHHSSSKKHHHHSRSQSHGSFRDDKKEMKHEEQIRTALRLSYRRQLNQARKSTLDLLNSMLNTKESQQGATGSGYSTDSAMQKRISDVISLALARSSLTAAGAAASSSASSSSSSSLSNHVQQVIRKQYSHNDDLIRIRAFRFAAARLNNLSLIPPQTFLGIRSATTSSGKRSSSSSPKDTFFDTYLSTSAAVESDLADLSVRLTVANFIDSGNVNEIVHHKALLARAIREGSISSQLAQRVFKLLLSQFAGSSSSSNNNTRTVTNYIQEVKWILDNSLLLHHLDGADASSLLPHQQNSAAVEDDLDDEIQETPVKDRIKKQTNKDDKHKKKKRSKDPNRPSASADDKHNDEEEEEEEEEQLSSSDSDGSIQELSNSISRITQAPSDVQQQNFWSKYPMLVSNSATKNKQRKLFFAILEILFYPLACDSENDDVGIADFLKSGSVSMFAGTNAQLSAIAASSQVSSAVSPTVRKRDKKTARDVRRCLKVFIRDCAVASTQNRDPGLLARIVHLVLDLRDMEMNKWRNPQYLTFLSSSNQQTSSPAEECKTLFYTFEQNSFGRGLSVIPSRYVLSRYMLSLEACQKDAALLWMTSQLGNVHQMKPYSHPLAIWMNEYAEQHVTSVCDLADIVNDNVEKLFEVLEKYSTSQQNNLQQQQSAQYVEKDLLKITNDVHQKLARLINAVYQGEAIFQKIPPLRSSTSSPVSSLSPREKNNNNNNDDEDHLNATAEHQQESARGYMGEVLDRIGDAMADSLGGWSELLTEVKQMNQILEAQELEREKEKAAAANTKSSGGMYRGTYSTHQLSKAEENMKLIARLVTKAIASSLQTILVPSLNRLPASLGRNVVDDTYQNIVATLEGFLDIAIKNRHANNNHDDDEETTEDEESDDVTAVG